MPVNKEYFLKNAFKYEPQYGGWCAYETRDINERVPVNTETVKIIEERIVFFLQFVLQ